MRKLNKIFYIIIYIVFFSFLLNCINLVVEIVKSDFEIEDLSFQNGYFTLNQHIIGNNVFTNFIGITIMLLLYLYVDKIKNKLF